MTNDNSDPEEGDGGIRLSLVSIIVLISKALGSTVKTLPA